MKYTSRKFLLALLVLAGCTALVWFGKIDDGVFSAVVISAIGGYFAANVTQKATAKTKTENEYTQPEV